MTEQASPDFSLRLRLRRPRIIYGRQGIRQNAQPRQKRRDLYSPVSGWQVSTTFFLLRLTRPTYDGVVSEFGARLA